MAKEETRSGYYPSKIRRVTQMKYDQYDTEINSRVKANKEHVLGPKMKIINAYKQNKNIKDAYKAANEINQKIGKEAYSKDKVVSWIKEEIEKEKRINKNRDEDDEAR